MSAPRFAAIGDEVQIDPTARIFGAERISIGSHVRIDAFAVLSAGADGIVIGDHVHIAAHVFMAGAARIEIQDFAGVSGRVSIYSSNDDYSGESLTGPTVPDELRAVSSAPVVVGRHVVIGAGSVVLPGVELGRGSAVGSLSLVRRSVEPHVIVAGAPARPVSRRSSAMFALEDRL